MIAVPAIDLRGGARVQLVGGDYADERVRLPDPVAVARGWTACGFGRLHLVDLDAATGCGSNTDAITAIISGTTARVQTGGGVRDDRRIAALLRDGAERVVVGTRAVADAAWLERTAVLFPGRLVVATDVRGREVVVDGWQTRTSRDVSDLVRELAALPLAGILVTAVHREGLMRGPDLGLIEDVAGGPVPLLASGGITTLDDLRALEALGVSQAILGMALYTGILDARTVAQEFAA